MATSVYQHQQPLGDTEERERDYEDREGDEYWLGEPAAHVYEALTENRELVCELARNMAELTVPSVYPEKHWLPGDDIPGNNQSIGSSAVNNLASVLTYLAFPPGQPMMRLEVDETAIQKEVDQNPDLYQKTQLALSRLELMHRKKATTVNLATAWNGYVAGLLVAGNMLWKHIRLPYPTYHRPDFYVVQRDNMGQQLLVIHEEQHVLCTLDEDWQKQILRERHDLKYQPKVRSKWQDKVVIYSVCETQFDAEGEISGYKYWEETERGTYLNGSGMDTEADDCPMHAGWLIPAYGHNWGRSYCELYRGDLYLVEAGSSSLNDGMATAGWTLGFLKPGSRTSLTQVRKARNLSILPGSAEDLTWSKTEKMADFNFVASNVDKAERRINAAFLNRFAIRRQGERVTAEEIQEMARALDQASGGLYTQIAQAHQKYMVQRFIRLHEESNPKLPKLDRDLVTIGVVTGVDAMGRDAETQGLLELGNAAQQYFPQQQVLKADGFLTRLAAGKGIKPDGLVVSAEEQQQAMQQQQQQAAQRELLSKAVGPATQGLMERLNSNADARQASQAEEQQPAS